MAAALPARLLRQLATLQPRLYVVDARRVADAVGLGGRINMAMQAAFFQTSGVLPLDKVGCCRCVCSVICIVLSALHQHGHAGSLLPDEWRAAPGQGGLLLPLTYPV